MDRRDVKKSDQNYEITYTLGEKGKVSLHFTFDNLKRAQAVAGFLEDQFEGLPLEVEDNRITIPPSSEKGIIGASYVRENDEAYVEVNFKDKHTRDMFQNFMTIREKDATKIKHSENSKDTGIRFNTKSIEPEITIPRERSEEGFENRYMSDIPSLEISPSRSEEGFKNRYMGLPPIEIKPQKFPRLQKLSPKAKNLVDQIEPKLAEFQKLGGVNRHGVWTNDPDGILKHKYDVLLATHSLLTRVHYDIGELSMVVDRATKYDVQRGYIKASDTARLLNEALKLENSNQPVPDLKTYITSPHFIPENEMPPRLTAFSKVEIGKSGYIYVDGQIHKKSSVIYTDRKNAEKFVKQFEEIQNKLKQIAKDGGYVNGVWKEDADPRYRDKYQALSQTMWFLLGEININDLSKVTDCNYEYKKSWGESGTKKLVDDAVQLRGFDGLKTVDEEFVATNANRDNPFSKQNNLLNKGSLNPHELGFHDFKIRAGESGYIYINNQLPLEINKKYGTKENRIECAKICNDIQTQMKKLINSGYENGKWKKESSRHKYELLSMTMGYLMGEVSHNQLSLVGDRCHQYQDTLIGTATTKKLLDRALTLNNEPPLKTITTELITHTQSPEIKLHSFFKSEKQGHVKKIEKRQMENMEIEVGPTGVVYLNRQPDAKLMEIYKTPEDAKACAKVCKEIQAHLKKLKNSAGPAWSKDKDGRLQDKYKTLTKAMEYVLGEATEEKLQATIDKHGQYKKTRINELLGQKINTSTTEDLYDRAKKLRKGKLLASERVLK